MLEKILSTAAANAKLVLAATAGAVLVAGGSAVAISNVSDTGSAPTAPSSAASQHISAQGAESRSDTATVGISPKPSHSPEANSGQGNSGDNHGACVSAVAKASPAPNASPGDHGKLVSATAKSDCGKPAGATTTQKTKGKSAAHKPAQAKTHTDSTDNASDAPDPSEAPEPSDAPNSGAPSSNGTSHSHGHAGGH